MIALIDAYRKELSDIAGFSSHTVETYVSGVIRYIDYTKNTLKINPVFSKGAYILKWMEEIRKTGISNSRMQHHHSALKTFSLYW